MATPLQETKRIEKMLSEGILLPRMIVLCGEESYYIDRIEDLIVTQYIEKENRDTERVILYGADSSMSEVALHAQSTSLFAEKRLVVLRDAQLLSDLDKLKPLIPKIPHGSTLLVSYRGNLRRSKSKLFGILESLPEETLLLIESPLIRNNRDILAIITQVATRCKAVVDEAARKRLIELVGFNGSVMSCEVEKLAIAAGSAPITHELVNKLIGFSRQYSTQELRNAVVKKDKLLALKIGEVMALDEKSYPLPLILATLYDFFANLMVVHFMPPSQRSPQNIATVLGLSNSYRADEYIIAPTRYSAIHTLHILHEIRMTDARFKGAESGDYRSESLLINLLIMILE